MNREETPQRLVHPEWVAGRRIWMDGTMATLIYKLHYGDPVRGWEGDPRLAVYWNPPVWEVMRLEHDGEYRMVCRSKPDVPFDERLIDALVEHDRRRAAVGLHDRITATNETIDADRRNRTNDYIAEEVAPRLRYVWGGAVTQLVDLRRYVRQRLGVPTSDDFFTDAVLTDLVNLAVNIIEEEHYWPWAEVVDPAATVPAGSGIVTKPARWRATRVLFTAVGDELDNASITDLLVYASVTGAPQAWADDGTNIRVAPIPTSATTLTHVYYRSPAPLIADTDEPDLPSSMADAIVAKAAELGSVCEDDQTARAAHNADYQKWMQRMQRSQRRTTGPLRVRVRPGSWI